MFNRFNALVGVMKSSRAEFGVISEFMLRTSVNDSLNNTLFTNALVRSVTKEVTSMKNNQGQSSFACY